jgi:hypothetical protein
MADYRRDDRERNIRPITLGGRKDSVNLSGASAPLGVSAAGDSSFPVELALSQSQGPWKKDRSTLSVEAQVVLMEMKAAGKSVVDFASHLYSNVITHLKVATGRVLKLEPYGGYRLVWHQPSSVQPS